MTAGRQGELIRRFILDNVESHPADITRLTLERFGVSRQAVSQHLRQLVSQGLLGQEGNTRSRRYWLSRLVDWTERYPITTGLGEDQPWRERVAPSLEDLGSNALAIWHYGFTEMFNNAIDHSEGTWIGVSLEKTATTTEMIVRDDGVGIFKKIQSALGLLDERHSLLELSKGKFTTDPAHHTGEGVFFTSRMFDDFAILSGDLHFSHAAGSTADWLIDAPRSRHGTFVFMKLRNSTSRSTTEVFDQYASGDDYGFAKTVVPVSLATYGDDSLVSRSQAKRMLARVERFSTVVLDFAGVDAIGQAFADEVFRVFPAEHPGVSLVEINARQAVERMVSRARSAR
jgi:anti-sigma regulatory factor (Ser/Thr protein kinase)